MSSAPLASQMLTESCPLPRAPQPKFAIFVCVVHKSVRKSCIMLNGGELSSAVPNGRLLAIFLSLNFVRSLIIEQHFEAHLSQISVDARMNMDVNQLLP